MTRTLLTSSELEEYLRSLPGWVLSPDGKALCKRFIFADFKTAFGWMTSMALTAERRDHHPEWTNVYNKVEVRLTTHDAGGVTELDVEMARRMEQHGIYSRFD